jgi:enoyl-CoA hydratase/carnithine racemase
MVFETLKTVREGAVLFVEIAAPPMNLLGPELVRDLVSLIQHAEGDDSVKVFVFTSVDPDYYIAHVDVTKIGEYRKEAAKLTGGASIALLFRHLSSSRLVTIAQIEGRARAAGSEFALACDMRFAARESAIFSQMEAAFGLIPGAGGAQHLARLMGRARAVEVMLGAEDFDATLAERYGWINRALSAPGWRCHLPRESHRCRPAALPTGRAAPARACPATCPASGRGARALHIAVASAPYSSRLSSRGLAPDGSSIAPARGHFKGSLQKKPMRPAERLARASSRGCPPLACFFDMLGNERARRIEFVASDMWAALINVVRARCGRAVHVLDRFHVMALLNKAIDETRREEVRRLRLPRARHTVTKFGDLDALDVLDLRATPFSPSSLIRHASSAPVSFWARRLCWSASCSAPVRAVVRAATSRALPGLFGTP